RTRTTSSCAPSNKIPAAKLACACGFKGLAQSCLSSSRSDAFTHFAQVCRYYLLQGLGQLLLDRPEVPVLCRIKKHGQDVENQIIAGLRAGKPGP
ncbi:MAG: hypothetical protein QHH07_07950, partial [Sedimentisphaerales bacterium]|nr:hypothetical protein [Sedimentisphaerales bacterium]